MDRGSNSTKNRCIPCWKLLYATVRENLIFIYSRYHTRGSLLHLLLHLIMIWFRFRNYDPLTTRMFSIYLNDEMELIGRHGDLYADYTVPKELRVRDLCVKTFNYYRMESECTLVCANGRVPNGDGKFNHQPSDQTHLVNLTTLNV